MKEKIRAVYYGWFFGPGAILRKDLDANYLNIQKNPEFTKVKKFEDIPSDNKMYDQMTQTIIVHDILMKHGKISPELFADRLLELNDKHNILENDQYGPSTQKAVRNLLDGKSPQETGKGGLTTGAAMRCMPIGVFFYNEIAKLIESTFQSSIISHNTDVAVSSALAVNLMISSLLNGKSKEKSLKDTLEVLKKNYGRYGEPTAFAYMHERIKDAVHMVKGKNFEEATKLIAERIGFSWYAIEQIPAGIATYFATKNAKEAELMSFRLGYGHTGPQIACALHGAEKGPDIFPQEIIQKIERANNIDIDKLANEMIEKVELMYHK